MKTLTLVTLLFILSMGFAFTEEKSTHPQEKRIYRTDSIGTPLTSQPHWVIQRDGSIYETDSIGMPQYGKPHYKIIGDKIYETDSLGTIRSDRSVKSLK